MLAPAFFRSRKFSHSTKRTAFDSLIVSVVLCGCESWAVTAEIERRLRSFQTQRCKQMPNISASVMIEDRVSAAAMRERLGAKDVVRRMRCLQLKWLGRVRNMPVTRLPRQLLVSWLPSSRRTNYPQTFSRTVAKALESVGIAERDFPAMSTNLRG
jgi:hypothetical protein